MDEFEKIEKVYKLLATLGPMVENVSITEGAFTSRVLFDMLHVNDEGTKVRRWSFSADEAILFLKGAVDGGAYAMNLALMASDRASKGTN